MALTPVAHAARRALIVARAEALADDLAARVDEARRRAREASFDELLDACAAPWSKTEPAEPKRVVITTRRVAVAAMTRKRQKPTPTEGPKGQPRKPAGWRFHDEQFWRRGDEKRCKECLHTSALDEGPFGSHRRTCSASPNPAILTAVAQVLGRPTSLPLPPVGPPVLVSQGRAASPVRRPLRKPPKPVRFEAFLAFVRGKPCRFCERSPPSDPHHFGPRGHGQKTSDLRTLPLCESSPAELYEGCHDKWHRTLCLGDMSIDETKAWINEQILALHDEYFGAWILDGEPPSAAEEKYLDALDEAAHDRPEVGTQ